MSNAIENALVVAVLLILIALPVYISVRNARKRKTKK